MNIFLIGIVKFLAPIQLFILFFSDLFFKAIFLNKKNKIVIGVHEIASNISHLSNVFENSISVNFNPNKFYNHNYDFSLNVENNYLRYALTFFYGPILLGYLMNISNNFVYIWETGFLINRGMEFKFLKRRGKKLILFFCGDDIRSPKLSFEYSDKLGVDNFLSYVNYDLDKQEKRVKENAEIADQYADLIFNFPICQISYLNKKTYYNPYIYNSKGFSNSVEKYDNIDKYRIVHAPSNPLIKGTMLVRAAIKKLMIQGYKIEYIEIQNKLNLEVVKELKKSHIVLNQFHGLGYAIGLFGVEALANSNCLLTSFSTEKLENDNIYSKLNEACVNTRYWEVYDKLKLLLDNPHQIKEYAVSGYNFAYENFEVNNARKFYNRVFNELIDN